MIDLELSSKTGGVALVVGFLLVLLLLYRDPTRAVAAATGTVQSLVFLLVLPIGGLVAGVYAYVEGPYHGTLAFLAGSYLGVFGLTLIVGFRPRSGPIAPLQGLGIVLLVASVVTILVSFQRLAEFLGLGQLVSSLTDRSRH